jgi:hypothetical protein
LSPEGCADCCPILQAAAKNPCVNVWWYDYPDLSSAYTGYLKTINGSGACGSIVLETMCGCNNGVKDSLETGVDCGGPTCFRTGGCPLQSQCNVGTDCESGSCGSGLCVEKSSGNNPYEDLLVAVVVILSVLILLAGVVGYLFWWSSAVQEDTRRKPDMQMEVRTGGAAYSETGGKKPAKTDEHHDEDVYVS